MIELLTQTLPYKVLFSHFLLIFLVAAVLSRNGWGRGVMNFLGRYAVAFAFLVSIASIAGSLFYSEVVGYEPCTLCWWLRVFLYPQAVIFGVALFRKYNNAFVYALPLTLLALLVSAYFSYTSLGGSSIIACTSAEGACSKVFVKEFGYITIPMMGLTVVLYLLLLTWVNKL